MIRRFLALAVLTALVACDNAEDVDELKSYVQIVHGFEDYNRQVEALITRFDDPTSAITDADITAARQKLDDYAAAVRAVPTPSENVLKHTTSCMCAPSAMRASLPAMRRVTRNGRRSPSPSVCVACAPPSKIVSIRPST